VEPAPGATAGTAAYPPDQIKIHSMSANPIRRRHHTGEKSRLGVPATVTVRAYRPEARELIVERQFPRVGIIPAELHYRVVSKALRVTMRKPAEIAKRYERLLASLTLRALDEVLNASPATLVDSVVFDGRVTAVDPATGKAVTPLLLSLQVERGAFEEILLDEPELDPCCA